MYEILETLREDLYAISYLNIMNPFMQTEHILVYFNLCQYSYCWFSFFM